MAIRSIVSCFLRKIPHSGSVRDFREFMRLFSIQFKVSDAYRPAFSSGVKEKVIKEVCKSVKSHRTENSITLTGYKHTEKF